MKISYTAIHAYRTINWDIVFSICTKHLEDFRSFASHIMAVLEKRGES